MGHWTFGQSLMMENNPHVLRHHASKRVGFSPNTCFKLEELKKKKKKNTHTHTHTSFKFSLHEIKKGTSIHLIGMNTSLKNPCLWACSLLRVNGSHWAHTIINHIGNMALWSLSCGTCWGLCPKTQFIGMT